MTPPPSLKVTSEADLIERQLRQPGMYPLPKTPLPSTSGFVSRLTPTFQPIVPDTSTEPVNTHHTNNSQNVETSPESSLICGQQTLWDQQALTAHHLNIHHHSQLCLHNLLHHSHITQTTHPCTHNPKRHHNHLPLHNLNNSLLLGQILIQPPSLPFQMQRHTNLCPAHLCSIFLSLQMVKESRAVSQRVNPVHPMDDSASVASNQDTSRKTAQSNRTASSAGQEDMYLQGALLNSRATG